MRTGARLGIMGGTFDPIHFGHLVTAEEALVQFNLDRVLFMPTGIPALKVRDDVTPAEDRYLMTVLATASNPDFDVSRDGGRPPGAHVHRGHAVSRCARCTGRSTELFFITGADAVWEIISWRDAETVADLATFIAATRPGYDLDAARRAHDSAQTRFRIEYVDVPALAISSTDLRARVREPAADSLLDSRARGRIHREARAVSGCGLARERDHIQPGVAQRFARRLGEAGAGHSERVAETAAQLASAYGLEPEPARLAGLLHDWDRERTPTRRSSSAARDAGIDADGGR